MIRYRYVREVVERHELLARLMREDAGRVHDAVRAVLRRRRLRSGESAPTDRPVA